MSVHSTAPVRRRRRRRGFSLLEVIVAVLIVAMLAALVVPRVLENIGRSKERIAKAEVNTLANQVRLYMADNGISRLDDDFRLERLLDPPRPYLNSAADLEDPWGNPYDILIPGQVNIDFDIVSYGANGAPGGEGEDADIFNGR